MNRLILFFGSFLLSWGLHSAIQEPIPATLNLREAVEIVADYEIYHPKVPDMTSWYGITDYDKRLIFIISNTDLATRRKIAIHEMLHAARRLRNETAESEDEEESAVRPGAEKIYNQLFGAP